jgi:hypothetical protein
MIVVATNREFEMAQQLFDDEILITGVGPLNVIEKLACIPKETEITNFGLCGSNYIEKGTKVEVKECELMHEKVDFETPSYILQENGVKCYTSNDFVTETKQTDPCVFDMELAYILALGFKNVKSIKIVSDNLNYNEYEGAVKHD